MGWGRVKLPSREHANQTRTNCSHTMSVQSRKTCMLGFPKVVSEQSKSRINNVLSMGHNIILPQPTLTDWKTRVTRNVCIGLTFGMTAKMVSPTRPLDVETIPDSLTGIPRSVLLATAQREVIGQDMHENSISLQRRRTLSSAVTKAQKLGAQ